MKQLWAGSSTLKCLLLRREDHDVYVYGTPRSRTDGQSERTSRTVEYALPFSVPAYHNAYWIFALTQTQTTLNSSNHAATGKAPNETSDRVCDQSFRGTRAFNIGSETDRL